MSDTLFRYYEEELTGFRQRGREFGEAYPSAAGRLRLDRSQHADPHVERLIQSFSFMNARIRKKLDDDFPELTDALLSILYPHYIAPTPSMATVQFKPEPANLPPSGATITRHSNIRTQAFGGVPCRYRTSYPVELWPVEITKAKMVTAPFPDTMQPPADANGAISLTLNVTGGHVFNSLALKNLRIHFDGESQFVAQLYEIIFNQCVSVEFRSTLDPSNSFSLAPEACIAPVGFSSSEAIVPYPKNSFVGYQLLTELFTFPEKFAYADLSGFQEVAARHMGNQIEVTFFISNAPARMASAIDQNAFKLGCTPVVNLFERICEPIQLSQKKVRYRVTPDVHHPDAYEVYSVDSVRSADPHNERVYHPFYSFQKPVSGEGSDAFWYGSRKESLRPRDDGTDVFLHFVDPNFDPRVPAEAALTVFATCTNRDMPVHLQAGREKLRFQLEAAIPVKSIECLHYPTAPLRASLGRKAQWQLISHLSLNHLSISDSEHALDSLKQILRLYDFSDRNSDSQRSATNRQMIEGINSISSRRVTRRIGSPADSAFCRGLQLEMNLDEEKYIGIGAFLFASVMRHFFGKYASINSFAELVATTQQREQPLRHWAPVTGEEQVV